MSSKLAATEFGYLKSFARSLLECKQHGVVWDWVRMMRGRLDSREV